MTSTCNIQLISCKNAQLMWGFFETFIPFWDVCTGWKVSKYGVLSGPYFPLFGLNTEIYSVNLRIQSKYRTIPTRHKPKIKYYSFKNITSFHLWERKLLVSWGRPGFPMMEETNMVWWREQTFGTRTYCLCLSKVC